MIDYLITIKVNILKYTRVEKLNAVEEVIIKLFMNFDVDNLILGNKM